MLCSVRVDICIDETGIIVLFVTGSKPTDRSTGEGGCYATPHSILTAALLLNE